MAPGLPSGSMCGSEMPMCFSTFPFVFSSLCVDATVTVFQGVRPAVTSSPGQSQAIRSLRACWAHLYLLCLFSIPFIHHPSACPQGSRSRPPPPLNPRPQSRGSVPSVCQRGYYFSTPEIQARWMLQLVWGMAPHDPLAWTWGELGLFGLAAVGGWWIHSAQRQRRFSSQPRPDNVSWLMFFTSSGERIETNARTWALPVCCSRHPGLYPWCYPHTIQHGHSTPNPPFCLTLLHTHTLTLFYLCETRLKQNDFMLLAY